MHAALLLVYRVMPCIEHPICWFAQCEVSWQMGQLNVQPRFITPCCRCDNFFENCKPVAACGFSDPDPLRTIFAIPVIISFLFGGSAFGIVTRRMTLEKLL